MRTIATLVVMTVALCCGFQSAHAQDKNAKPDEEKPSTQDNTKSDQRDVAIKPYRLDFVLNELQDGKKINSRHYSMNLAGGSADEIKIGTRVPVPVFGNPTGAPPVNTQYQYIDVGTNIWASLRERGDDLQLEVRSDTSNLDQSGQDQPDMKWLPPVVRQIKISGVTLLETGKPILIGSMDDPNSNRQFQLEVTATKLK